MQHMEQGFEYFSISNLDAGTCEQVLDAISDKLLQKGLIHDSFREAVKERERLYPTGIKTLRCGVAIPHVEPEHVIKNTICAVTLKQPVVFGEMGGDEADCVDVECLFVCLLNERDDRHKKTLARAMDILQNAEDLDRIRNSVSDGEIQEVLAGYIGAGI